MLTLYTQNKPSNMTNSDVNYQKYRHCLDNYSKYGFSSQFSPIDQFPTSGNRNSQSSSQNPQFSPHSTNHEQNSQNNPPPPTSFAQLSRSNSILTGNNQSGYGLGGAHHVTPTTPLKTHQNIFPQSPSLIQNFQKNNMLYSTSGRDNATNSNHFGAQFHSILSIVDLQSGHRIDISLTNISLSADLSLPLSVLTSAVHNDDNGGERQFDQTVFSSKTRRGREDPLLQLQQQLKQDQVLKQRQLYQSGDNNNNNNPLMLLHSQNKNKNKTEHKNDDKNSDKNNAKMSQSIKDVLLLQNRELVQRRLEIKINNYQYVFNDLLSMNIIPYWLVDYQKISSQLNLEQNRQQNRQQNQQQNRQQNQQQNQQHFVETRPKILQNGKPLKSEVASLISPLISIPITHARSSSSQNSSNLNSEQQKKPHIIINNAFGTKLTLQCASKQQKELLCDVLQSNIAARMVFTPGNNHHGGNYGHQ
jgi:hypothetical protein